MYIDEAHTIVKLAKKLYSFDNSFGEFNENKTFKKLKDEAEKMECDFEETFQFLVVRAEGIIEGYNTKEEDNRAR